MTDPSEPEPNDAAAILADLARAAWDSQMAADPCMRRHSAIAASTRAAGQRSGALAADVERLTGFLGRDRDRAG